MEVKLIAYPIGHTIPKSNKETGEIGKTGYTFIQGTLAKNGMIIAPQTLSCWTKVDLKLEFMKPVQILADVMAVPSGKGSATLISRISEVNGIAVDTDMIESMPPLPNDDDLPY